MKKSKKKILGDNLSLSQKKNLQMIEDFYLKNNKKINASEHFPLFITREKLTSYLVKYELFKKILDVKGSIVECGSFKGSSLLFFSKLSSIFEPYNIHKKIISFDTYEGFPNVNPKDNLKNQNTKKKYGSDTNLDIIKESIDLFDLSRVNGHLNKVEIVKGDAIKTIPKYLSDNKHALVSLLYLDFDLYKPTVVALKNFLPRMPSGSIIVFDELNQKRWYGETVALLEQFDLNKKKLKSFPYEPHISYFQL